MGLFKKYTDINLIDGIRQQDDKILNWLYDNYFQQVKKHVISNSGSDDDVSDVFQDSIIALYKQIIEDRLNLTTDLKGYFFSIARNVWSAQLRRIRRTSVLETDIADEDDNSLIDDPTLGRVVSRAFLKLKPDQQMVLRLFSEGKSYEVISEIMGFKNETYARRKKYLCKEAVIELVKEDPEYQEYLRLLR